MTKQLSKNAVIEATAGAIPAVLLSAMPQQPVIPQKETGMSKVWPFLAGVLVGAAGVVAAAYAVDHLENMGSDLDADDDDTEEEDEGTTAHAEDRRQTS